ncbi:MAG: (Fe-S)-binding protein [Bacillota bacterium]
MKKYKGQEYLLFVGSVGSYDPRAQKISKALSSILIKAGISFGILGIEETDDGNEVNKVGERGLFEYLADENIEKFKNLGVKKIITLSPHSFNAIKNNYPAFGGDFEVMHYTQFLKQLIETGQLQIKGRLDADVTFHDPCFLGRYNKEYEAPRFLLGSIPGLRLIEMERNKEDSFCCGGGGGNFFTDFLGSGEKGAGRIRIREAFDTKAKILAVACPMCAGMFEDALKMEWLEDEFTVKDIAEIINELI